ncbi:hypothetical protein C8A01DRAFT_17935 [Parachaetomium inaequale]|uniref:Uncharacterized protein n=1 Tax=Parachaetomium inaequale TaxID=2588326 RepID=A0AAN6PBK2_9PEZI|nr:hypothetical protein C8A01DRAFT_17935 [Parachaetomium inaequale]
MDILFSPYGVGGLPKSAMAEMERRTEDLLKSSSFQGMLELEKKHKMDRLRGPQALLPPSQHPAQLKDGPPPRPERPDSLFPHEQFLMVKATRRTVIPSLSLAIPQAAENERRNRSNEWEAEEDDEYANVGTPTNSEPFQKQVKFLAPEDKDDEEDGMSEQSSICQSPSWEGYGQRKKDKKLEAERRKKEKEQAEKEAKAAKKRNTARLSKAPPPPPPPATTHRASRALALTAADRSMSDPLLVSRHLLQSTQSIHRPEEVGRTASADDIQQSRWHQSVTVVSGSSSSAWCGDTIGDPSATHYLYDNAFAPRQEFYRSMSEGPALPNQQSASTFPLRHESRSPRDAFPPSASRTPRLRHMSPSGTRGNSLLQGAASANHSQESLSTTPTVDGTRRNGYVLHQRAQVTERAMAGLADEQLVANIGQHYPPSSSSSGQTQHVRRPSLTQEAKSVAMKLVGIKTPSSARDGTGQTDYLTFKAIPYASSVDTFASVGSIPASPRSVDGSFRRDDHERPSTSAAQERPQTSQSSASLIDPSIAGSGASGHSKKSRNLKDVTKAALSRSKGPQKAVESSKPSVPVPPYFRLRALVNSRASVYAESKTSPAANENTNTSQNPTTAVSVSEQAKPTEMGSQGGSRASEGSSSSSAYEDGSPLPSPTTTPDTSRPQSAKDIPLAASTPTKDNSESFGLQDDERTLRQSLDSSKSSTPRVGHSGTRGSFEMGNEDRWSRTALPIDLDCDAQSFMTTVSNFDNVEDTEKVSSRSPSSPRAKTEQPEPLKLVSKTNMRTGDAEPAISIPPRSRKRSQSSPNGSPVASSPIKQRQKDQATSQGTTGASEEHVGMAEVRESPKLRASSNYARPFEQAEEVGKEGVPGTYKKKYQPMQTGPRESEVVVELKGQMDAPGSPQRDWTSGSISPASSAVPSAGSTPPHALSSDFQTTSSPYFADLSEPLKYHGISGEMPTPTGPPSPISLPSPLHQVPSKVPAQPRANSAPLPSLASTAPSRASTPSARTAPVSILKQPKSSASDRPPALSALPKHMQLQASLPAVRSPTSLGETMRMAPFAKMFVECCSCKFYHDMPSKLYECMAKPDAVVEDKLLGISGAITTMVKCPWCHHNMSRACCAGYAAVVYLKEKLH